MVITHFEGEHRFLSNFYPNTYGLSVEHNYQAAKTTNPEDKKWILSAPSPREAKRRGRKVVIRKGWDSDKLKIMEDLLRIKFSDPVLKDKLLSTKDAILIEGNTWHDTFWGNCPIGTGENHLGRLLMKLRSEYQQQES